MRTIKLLIFAAALTVSLAGIAFGQETTGTIEGTVKDPQGNVVPGVAVTLEGVTVGFRRTATSDDLGRFTFTQVPPGKYRLTSAAAAGFGEGELTEVQVGLGAATPVTFNLQAAGTRASVDITTADQAPIDVTGNKIQTNITQRTAELLPKGVNFTSLLNVAPAVRQEALSGGFQIDGASGSENTFIIDGQEVSNFRTGVLNLNNNIPFQFVQEVQVKSSGFEAEFGGATGGVINVVTRGGSNEFHGTAFEFFRHNSLNANNFFLNRADQPKPKLKYNNFGGNFSGPIVKNRIFFFWSEEWRRERRGREAPGSALGLGARAGQRLREHCDGRGGGLRQRRAGRQRALRHRWQGR